MAIIKVRNPAIDLDAAEIPNLDASKITTGSFDASRIGSGTFADARIAASNVSQHATSFDDNKIVNDISTLALRQASDANRSAYSTNSQSVDVFQDATGIDTTTNVLRNASEYVSSNGEGSLTTYQTTDLTASRLTGVGSPASFTDSGLINGDVSTYYMYIASPSGYNKGFQYDISGDTNFGSDFKVKKVSWYNYNTIGRFKDYIVKLNGTQVDITPEDNSSQNGVQVLRAANTNGWNTAVITNPVAGANFQVLFDGFYNNGNENTGIAEIRFSGNPQIVNATGNFTGTTITAPSSVSSMGAIITYQDNAGTNALNTDIVLQLSADGGSNYSTATLTALPDFSTGIKMAKVNDLAVTSGTSLKYKISFANQASGSKEARIRGVALQY